MHTPSRIHTHTKPPSGQGLTLTLKGLCLAPVIATPQTRYVVNISMSMPLCVLWAQVCETTMYGVNSCRHPWHLELVVTWVCVHVHCGLFLSVQLRNNSSSTNNAQRSRTIVPLNVFVCGCGETGNEIMLGALAVCARSLSKSRARSGQEYQSHISWPRWAYGNEECLFQCNVLKQGGFWGYTRNCHLSPASYLSLSFHSSSYLLDSYPPSFFNVSVWNLSHQRKG